KTSHQLQAATTPIPANFSVTKIRPRIPKIGKPVLISTHLLLCYKLNNTYTILFTTHLCFLNTGILPCELKSHYTIVTNYSIAFNVAHFISPLVQTHLLRYS